MRSIGISADPGRGVVRPTRSGVLLFLLAILPASVEAQCAFDRPNGSTGSVASLSATLVRAFVSCGNPGGNTVNATTILGIPSCAPPETFHQQAVSPPGGWEFHNGTSYGKFYLKRTGGGENLNLPPPLRDAVLKLKLYHIARAGDPGFANGTGSVLVVLRVTTEDYASGDMTIIDCPLGLPITLNAGTGYVTKKVGDILLGQLHQPRFSDCTSVEFISLAVRDPNGDVFAVPGVRY